MNFLNNVYQKKITENEKNIRYWEMYINKLQILDFTVYADKLKVPALVPIGSRIFFRGELKHTNEVTVALGADYFVKCSLKQAEEIKQHRIKTSNRIPFTDLNETSVIAILYNSIAEAQEKLDTYIKERNYIENQLTFSKEIASAKHGQDIVEYQTEEEDKIWRQQHRENLRKFKQSKIKELVEEPQVTDEELWNRLEELEIQEDLENEMLEGREDNDGERNTDSFVIKEESISKHIPKLQTITDLDKIKDCKEENKPMNEESTWKPTSKHDLLQIVLDKQNELEEKLLKLRNKDRSKSKTDKDLMTRLDEMEQLDELEDEMDRLDDILQTEDVEDSEGEDETSSLSKAKIKKGVSFADEDDSETLEITFKHSDIEPSNEPYYDPKRGIQKPSDIYEAHSNLFSGATSILKKNLFVDKVSHVEMPKVEKKEWIIFEEPDDESEDANEGKTIVVKDVVEKDEQKHNKQENIGARPTSLFKKRRQQMKS